jgi:hypothetical protein
MKTTKFLIMVMALMVLIPGVAFADPVTTPAPASWSFAEVMALLALLLAGVGSAVDAVRAILHFTAPRTSSTLDDRAAASLDALHDRLLTLERLVPAPAPVGTPIVLAPAKVTP